MRAAPPLRGPVSRVRIVAIAAWALGASACASWQARPDVLQGTLGRREQVRLWVRGEGHQVHGVRTDGDSLTAVPFIRSPTCDSCALRFAVRDIDSVQVRAFEWRRSVVAAVILAPVLYLFYLMSQIPRE